MKHLTPRVSNEGPDSTGFLLKDRFCSTEQIASATIGKCDVGADCQGLIAENATMKGLAPRVSKPEVLDRIGTHVIASLLEELPNYW